MEGKERAKGRRVAMANFACQWDPSNRVNEKMPEAGEMAATLFFSYNYFDFYLSSCVFVFQKDERIVVHVA